MTSDLEASSEESDIDFPSNLVERMSELEGLRRKHTIMGLYSQLEKHPGLLERRLHVGSQKPDVNSNQVSVYRYLHAPLQFMLTAFVQIDKRGSLLDVDLARSVCPARTEWRMIHSAKDINDTEVQVYQPDLSTSQAQQWFYTVNCMNDHPSQDRECPGCCIGINHNR
jgi:hypothetical protein